MKKIAAIALSLMLVAAVFTGCAKAKDKDELADQSVAQAAESIADEAADAAQSAVQSGSDADTASAFYSAYMDAKSAVLNRIVDGLGNNPDSAMAVMSFLGASLSDLYLLPAMYFGMGESSVATALAMMGAKDVTYDEKGNVYTVTYKNSDDHVSVLTGTYDNGKSLVSVGSTDGVENVYSEVYRTSFGYVGQFYAISDDGTTNLYQFSINGENGVVGISSSIARPAALTGGESYDFPKSSKEWYAIDGDMITGVNSNGESVSFAYVPSEGD